jgi:hypothetical protein
MDKRRPEIGDIWSSIHPSGKKIYFMILELSKPNSYIYLCLDLQKGAVSDKYVSWDWDHWLLEA